MTGNPISVGVTPSAATLDPTQTRQLIATVTGDPNNSVNWSISPNGLGTISNTGLYTAPPAVTSQQTVVVRAASTADATKFATAVITLTPPAPGPRPLNVYNTGLYPYATWPDPHYTLVSSADPVFPGPMAFIVPSNYPVGGPWRDNGPVSNWIAPQAGPGNGNLNGTYVYRTTFDMTGLDPSTAAITGQFAADALASVQLNHVDAGVTSASYTTFTPFTLNHGFAPGINTVDFTVANGRGITGLRVEMSGTASPYASGVTVAVNPSTPSLYPSQTMSFAASVTGNSNTGVTWSVSPSGVGSISNTGVYTAPAVIANQQFVTIRATSVYDATRSGIAYVTLNPAPGGFPAIRVNAGGGA